MAGGGSFRQLLFGVCFGFAAGVAMVSLLRTPSSLQTQPHNQPPFVLAANTKCPEKIIEKIIEKPVERIVEKVVYKEPEPKNAENAKDAKNAGNAGNAGNAENAKNAKGCSLDVALPGMKPGEALVKYTADQGYYTKGIRPMVIKVSTTNPPFYIATGDPEVNKI
jgi:hypothetical protein